MGMYDGSSRLPSMIPEYLDIADPIELGVLDVPLPVGEQHSLNLLLGHGGWMKMMLRAFDDNLVHATAPHQGVNAIAFHSIAAAPRQCWVKVWKRPYPPSRGVGFTALSVRPYLWRGHILMPGAEGAFGIMVMLDGGPYPWQWTLGPQGRYDDPISGHPVPSHLGVPHDPSQPSVTHYIWIGPQLRQGQSLQIRPMLYNGISFQVVSLHRLCEGTWMTAYIHVKRAIFVPQCQFRLDNSGKNLAS